MLASLLFLFLLIVKINDTLVSPLSLSFEFIAIITGKKKKNGNLPRNFQVRIFFSEKKKLTSLVHGCNAMPLFFFVFFSLFLLERKKKGGKTSPTAQQKKNPVLTVSLLGAIITTIITVTVFNNSIDTSIQPIFLLVILFLFMQPACLWIRRRRG